MLLFKHSFYFLIFFMLSGCGFEPLYSPHLSNRSNQFYSIKIALIPDRHGQILRNYLLDSLNPLGESHNPLYRLVVNLDIIGSDFSFRKDATPSRTILNSKAKICLIDIITNKIIYEDTAEATTTFGIGPHSDYATFPTITSEKREIDRAMNLLAQEIKLQIASFFASKSTAKR